MKKLNARKAIFVLSILNCIAVIAVIACCMPATVATHFNYKGEADAWGSKWNYIMFAFMPLILSVIYEIYRKKSGNAKGNQAIEDKLIPLTSLFFVALGWLMIPLSDADQMTLQAGSGVFIILGILMIILSNYMGKMRPNRTLGVRIPWTLKNETVWKKTHRLSGFTGVAGGAVLTVSGIIGLFSREDAFVFGMVGLVIALILLVGIPMVYSWLLYKKIVRNS